MWADDWHICVSAVGCANSECGCKPSDISITSSSKVYGVQAQGFINEAHFMPDCNLAFPVWPVEEGPVLPSVHGGKDVEDHSWSYILAKNIWEEVLLAASQRGLTA